MDPVSLFQALEFASIRYRDHPQKGVYPIPTLHHSISVTTQLTHSLNTDLITLQAALLHGLLEDTQTTYEELVQYFGREVAEVVREVTEDKTLSRDQRKRSQVVRAPHLSVRAKHIKLSDLLVNLRDTLVSPTPGSTKVHIQGFCHWSRLVTEGLRGVDAVLETQLDAIFEGTFTWEGETVPCCPPDLGESHIFPTDASLTILE